MLWHSKPARVEKELVRLKVLLLLGNNFELVAGMIKIVEFELCERLQWIFIILLVIARLTVCYQESSRGCKELLYLSLTLTIVVYIRLTFD